jgi:hypothetical protein
VTEWCRYHQVSICEPRYKLREQKYEQHANDVKPVKRIPTFLFGENSSTIVLLVLNILRCISFSWPWLLYRRSSELQVWRSRLQEQLCQTRGHSNSLRNTVTFNPKGLPSQIVTDIQWWRQTPKTKRESIFLDPFLTIDFEIFDTVHTGQDKTNRGSNAESSNSFIGSRTNCAHVH